MSAQTPTPWRVGPYYKSDVLNQEGGTICTCRPMGSPAAEANADFIVRAVNSHDAMREALENLLPHVLFVEASMQAVDAARAALKAAKEEA